MPLYFVLRTQFVCLFIYTQSETKKKHCVSLFEKTEIVNKVLCQFFCLSLGISEKIKSFAFTFEDISVKRMQI